MRNFRLKKTSVKKCKQLDPNGALDVLLTLYVGDVLPDRIGEVIERKLVSMLDKPSGVVDDPIGSRVNLVRRENIPFFGSHWK